MTFRIIEPDDPRYLDEFYRGWGVGQSITHHQEPRSGDQDDTPKEPQEPQQKQDPS